MRFSIWTTVITLAVFGCGQKKEVPEIDPNATRQVLQNVKFGDYVVLNLRLQSKQAFDAASHCMQWIEYRLNGIVHTQRLEISQKTCPNEGALDATTRVAQLKLKPAATNEYVVSVGDKEVGQFALDAVHNTGYALETLCAFSETDPSPYRNNCEVKLENGLIKEISLK